MATPQLVVGQINKALASVNWTNVPALNVAVGNMGMEQFRLAIEGAASNAIGVAAGIVQSPELYQMATITIPVLKHQPLSWAYKAQIENNSYLGPCVARTDGVGYPAYDLLGMAFAGIREISTDGRDATIVYTFRGVYQVNAGVWS